MEKEAEEERMRKQRAATERAFQDGITKARLVMRRTPLGTDRSHNRSVLQIKDYTPDKWTLVNTHLCRDVLLFSGTGFSLTWFLVCTLRKAGCMKASTTASLLHPRTNQLSLRWKRKRTAGRPLLKIHKVQSLKYKLSSSKCVCLEKSKPFWSFSATLSVQICFFCD